MVICTSPLLAFFFFFCSTRASHCCGLSRCGAQGPDAQAQRPWLTGPAAPRHVGSSRTRTRTRVPCIGRRTLNHRATREAPTFAFNVAIIILRLLMYFKKLQMQQFQKYHAVVLSIIIWMAGAVIFWPIFFLQYGTHPSYSEQRCFEFYRDLNHRECIILNYSTIIIMMTTVATLFLIQMGVIVQLVKTLWPDMWAHQECRAQIQSFFFLLVIVVCFVPHHAFRVHFIQHYSEIENSELVLYNEIFVALTTACCLDMLCFVGGVIH
ncbi:probable G-protein coupled receptor 141 [Monodon monoceros]|uniref:probable G-protein coupled receptor 141 n=1 Tax=Monodon monoceros TaxID=40151 RepID=UPI0010F80B70|nr:probable G-protein coupled receptor 141 [Monodon monoceros]